MLVLGIALDSVWGWYFVVVAIAIDLGVMVRFGFLAAVVTVVTQDLLRQAPLTLDTDQWYYGRNFCFRHPRLRMICQTIAANSLA